MNLFSDKTPLEQDTETFDALTREISEAARHLIATMTDARQRFWGMGSERALAVLNSNVALHAIRLDANRTLGTALNTALDGVNLSGFEARLEVELPAGYSFDEENSVFVYEEPEAPE